MQWLRTNEGPLSAAASIGSILSLVGSGLSAVYTYYRPEPAAVVAPFDSGERRPVPPGGVTEPRERPEDPFTPKIQLLLYGVPLANVPPAVQQSLEAAAVIVHRTPDQQRQTEDSLLRLLTSLGYVPDDVPSAIHWQDWHTIAVVPVPKEVPEVRPRILTLNPPPSPPQNFDPRGSTPTGGQKI